MSRVWQSELNSVGEEQNTPAEKHQVAPNRRHGGNNSDS